MAPRLRVAIDTNILLSGLLWRGTPHLVLELGKEGEIRLVVPEVVRWEASRVVGRLGRGSEGALERFFQLLGARVQMVPVPSKDAVVEASRFVRDATDAPILASIIAARPDYFISGDEDFTNPETGRRSPVPILQASEFLEVYLRRAARRLQKHKPDLYLKILLYVTTPE